MRGARCKVCKTEYPALENLGELPTQGNGCASSVMVTMGEEIVVRGHYGSKHDLREFRTRKVPEGWPMRKIANFPLDPVCDKCIDRAVTAGELVLDPELAF